MAVPQELVGEVTAASSAHSLLLGYALDQHYVLQPWEDTVRIARGGPYCYSTYDALLRDGRVFGAFRKRVKESTSQDWAVEPASDDATDTRAAEIVEAQLKAMSYDTYQARRLSAILKGLSMGEAMVREPSSRKEADRLGKTAIYHDVRFRKPWEFRFTHHPEEARTHVNWVGVGGNIRGGGKDLEVHHPRKFLWYSWGSEYGDPYGKGLGHQLYWPVFFKRQDWKLWLYYADKHGMPTVDVAYDTEKLEANTDQQRRDDLITEAENAGKKVRTEGVLVHPDAFVYKLLEATRRGDVKTYSDMIDYCDREIAIAILGSTLAVDLQGEGSRSAAETHSGDVRQLAEDDANEVCERDGDTLVRWISELNVPDATPPTIYRQFPDTTDYKGQAETVKLVMEAVAKGYDVDDAERTFGIVIDRKRIGSPDPPDEDGEPADEEGEGGEENQE